MSVLFLDAETYSDVPINHGTHAYATGAEIMVLAFAVDDRDVQVLDFAQRDTPEIRDMLRQTVEQVDRVVIHNSTFDRTVLRHAWGYELPVEKIDDTMVMALSHSLPGSLDKLCDIFRLPIDQAKSKEGKALIQLFCKPRPKKQKLRRATRETHPEEWAKFLDYARLDIEAMRAIYHKLPRWNLDRANNMLRERELWELDQQINDRGFAVDVELARAAVEAVEREKGELAEQAQELTYGTVTSATKRDELLRFILAAHDIELPDLKAATIEKLLEDDIPAELRELLLVRLRASTASVAKYKALLRAVSHDARLRGTMQFCGANRTGRWAGRIFQPQNLPRPAIGDLRDEALQRAIDDGIEAMKAGTLDLVTDNVMEVASAAVRGTIVAAPGKKLVVADLSNIEGRVLAWLAGEMWKLRAFADYDKGEGHDLYKLTAGRILGKSPEQITKYERQSVGKTPELACFGPETLVLTEARGYVRLIDVSTNDRLWDGETWVAHAGLVARGARPVVNVAGIAVTPDHLIRTGRTWKPAQQLVSSEDLTRLALATGSENLPSSELSARRTASQSSTWFGSSVPVAHRPISFTSTICGRVPAPGVTPAQRSRRATGVRTSTATQASCRMTNTVGGFAIGYRRASTAATIRMMRATRTTAVGALKSSNRGGQIVAHSLLISAPSTGGTTPRSTSTEPTSTRVTSPATFASSLAARTRTTDGRSRHYNSELPTLKRKLPVYDLCLVGPNNRFTILSERGPLLVHNCGYEGGVGAFITFADAYGLDIDELADKARPALHPSILGEARAIWDWSKKKKRETYGLSEETWVAIEAVKRSWRKAHPAITQFWEDAANAVRDAIRQPGKHFEVGRVTCVRNGAWLRIILPSGRSLCYPSPQVDEHGQISYMGVNQFNRRWGRIKTYGGKLAENITQAAARDVLAHGAMLAEAQGFAITLSVHDELITEAPDTDEFTAEALAAAMSQNPAWAEGLPLAAAGFTTHRYRKE